MPGALSASDPIGKGQLMACETERREGGAKRGGLLICGVAALLVVAFAAREFSSPTRLRDGVGGAAAHGMPGPGPIAGDRASRSDIAKMADFAAGRTGYVVWESRRPSGTQELKYRIWKRNLDGTGLAMVSGQRHRRGYAHLGPRISPDGRRVIYAGRHWNSGERRGGAQALLGGAYVAGPFDAWIVEVDPVTGEPGQPRELVAVRGLLGSAGADRFFVWKDCRTVYVNIPSQEGIFEFDVVSGNILRKVVEGVDGQFLLSASGKWLFRGVPGGVAVVSLVDTLTAQKPGKARPLPGCQGVMASADDVLIWMRSPGRASTLDLRTGEAATPRTLSLRESTRRVYGPYHYGYFPSLSRDGGIVACGVSRFPPSATGAKSYQCWLRHSHKSADYEIFLYALDKGTGNVTGPPVRYSFNDHSMYPSLMRGDVPESELRRGQVLDRFPDVWTDSPAANSSDNAADIREAGEAALARARALETIEPGTVLRVYDAAATEFAGQAAGRRARERAAALRADPAFRREAAAWVVFERMRSIEKKLSAALGPGPERGQLQDTCAKELGGIRAGHAELLANHPGTRAMLDARQLVRRWNIHVPLETEASRQVVAVVEAVAVNVSTPKTLKEIYPYTQAFVTAEFEVRETISGSVEGKRFVAVLMSMDDGEDLPAASLKPGAVLRLRLGSWASQKHLQNHALADDILELDAAYYFVFQASRDTRITRR